MSGRTGPLRKYYPLDPALMGRVCRKLAADLRAEHAAGLGSISLTGAGSADMVRVSRAQAAVAMDEQAERWEREVRDGIPNEISRRRIGELTASETTTRTDK